MVDVWTLERRKGSGLGNSTCGDEVPVGHIVAARRRRRVDRLYAEHDLAAHRDHERRYSVLECIGTGHRVVLVSLIVTIISGVLLFASDADAFLHSRFFWTKMALVGLLIVNGAFLRYADKRAITIPTTRAEGGASSSRA
jgi:hypothetical protein